jgi:hypothetical protein
MQKITFFSVRTTPFTSFECPIKGGVKKVTLLRRLLPIATLIRAELKVQVALHLHLTQIGKK